LSRLKPIFMFELLLIPLFALLFALLHVITDNFLGFAEITPHVSLIYLPAFSRMLHVILLGKFRGTLATALGGMLLMQGLDGFNLIGFMNVACSASGPLLAIWWFERTHGRPVSLTSLKDLGWVTLVYCTANAGVHHMVWTIFDPRQLASPDLLVWMMLGDLNGALLGAYALKWAASRFQLQRR
jgi:hypothetical protein